MLNRTELEDFSNVGQGCRGPVFQRIVAQAHLAIELQKRVKELETANALLRSTTN